MKALIDGDVVVYQCGFASDGQIYTTEDGAQFPLKKEAVTHSKINGLLLPAIQKTVEPEPVEHCLHSVKIFIKNVLKNIDADSYQVFLTGGGQWRPERFPQYKANRDPTHKPTHYKAIREYLMEFHNGSDIIGSEADDALAWTQMMDPGTKANDQMAAESCICTIDKDLNMVPGFHFNWNRDDLFWVDPDVGTRVFFEQWLVGDASDNIPGIKGVGDKSAQKILAGTPTAPLQLYLRVMEEWEKRGIIPSGACPRAYMHMVGDLLWMEQIAGQTWDQHYGIERLRYETAEA